MATVAYESSPCPKSSTKRAVQPGYSMTTTISSTPPRRGSPYPRAQLAIAIEKDARERYPYAAAVVQLAFRALSTVALLALVIIANILQHIFSCPYITPVYGVAAYCWILNAVEVLALVNPTWPLVLEKFTASLRNPAKRAAWPRLPTPALAFAEATAVAALSWCIHIFINSGHSEQSMPQMLLRVECPPETCVTTMDKYHIAGFIVSVLAGQIHVAFLFVTLGHWLRVAGPNVLDRLGW